MGKSVRFRSFPSFRLGMRPWKLLLPETRQARACKASVPKQELGNQINQNFYLWRYIMRKNMVVLFLCGSALYGAEVTSNQEWTKQEKEVATQGCLMDFGQKLYLNYRAKYPEEAKKFDFPWDMKNAPTVFKDAISKRIVPICTCLVETSSSEMNFSQYSPAVVIKKLDPKSGECRPELVAKE